MAATLKKPSWEKEEVGAGNMMLDVHPLHPSRPFPNRKPNRENRIKNACFSNSHSNIALSNDKRPLFVQIPATPSASLVSTSLPIQCLRPTNFFFCRGIFPNDFLRRVLNTPRKGSKTHLTVRPSPMDRPKIPEFSDFRFVFLPQKHAFLDHHY